MIFWFSGTGNSYHTALEVKSRFGGDLVNMAEALQNKHFEYEIGEEERCFFVFPVYFGGIPKTVCSFLEHISFQGKPYEIIGIASCGSSAFGTDYQFSKLIEDAGYSVRAFYDVKMPLNTIFWLKTPIREAALMTLKRSDSRIRDILDSVAFNHRMPYEKRFSNKLTSSIEYKFYGPMQKTKKFQVSDKCIGCGLCQKNCPVGAITLKEGRPVWTKETCDKCTACINRCPVEAINYGRGTRKRYRYVHPDFQKLDKNKE